MKKFFKFFLKQGLPLQGWGINVILNKTKPFKQIIVC
jgi:hypothetical protein